MWRLATTLKNRAKLKSQTSKTKIKIKKMKNLTKAILPLLVSCGMTSCITMQSATISDVKPSTGTEVRSSAGGLGILGLSAPRNISEKATYKLKNKGAVGNVSTVLTMRNWGIVQYYKVTATGTTESK